MSARISALIVFAASAAVLVVEIAAGRLMAPYVGVSLETFTGIIGVVLAGIAIGAATGGRLADERQPRTLLAPALGLGGVFVWLSVPIVAAIGPQLGSGPAAIILLAAFGFLVPAILLSAVTPIVAKMRLADLGQTGSVFGGLSAAGTAGGLLGSFMTGFVLVAAIGTRAILFLVGGLLVAGAIAVHWWLRPDGVSATPPAQALAIAAIAGVGVFGFSSACDVETRYACANIEIDEDDPSLVSLYLDRSHHARVDLDDPEHLEFRYIRLFASVIDAQPEGPIDVLHIGGGGFTLPNYIDAVRPGSSGHVLEIDPGVVDIATEHLGFTPSETLTVDVTDARTALADLPTDNYDVIVGDAFSGQSVPWHLTTREVAVELDRLLRPGGIYVVNVIDGSPNAFARAEIATLAAEFDHVQIIVPDESWAADSASGASGVSGPARNQVIVASDGPLPTLTFDQADGVMLDIGETRDYADDADVLTDDYAPVDQLVSN